MSTALVVPSRGRPDAISKLAWAFNQTNSNPGVHWFVAVDDDDLNLDLYRDATPSWATLLVGPRLRLGPTLNKVALELAESGRYDVIGFMGDDHRPRTIGWNAEIAAALRDAPGVAYGNDLIHGPNIPTAAFISSEIVRRLGYFVPPGILHLFADNAWKVIGEATNLHYLPDVIIEHLHPIAGKAEWDQGYRENNSSDVWQHDEAVFKAWLADDGWRRTLRSETDSDTVG